MSDLIDLKSHSVNTVLNLLLKDRTTNKNIIFATDAYDNIDFTTEITKKLLLSGSVDIRPRVLKSLEEQTQRTRKKAEVFTPAWICNKMNNHCDTEWFGRENVFNIEQNHNWIATTEKITFPKEKSWKDYVNSKRLEITCGEAPYIVSRYDVSTGNIIPIEKRIGILDRKLRVINENVHTYKLWNQWVYKAFESTYGYEFQGDNLLIARINLIETFCEYTRHKWNVEPTNSSLKHIANIISWNIWQMDGIHGVIPYVGAVCEQENEPYQMNLFEMWGMNDEIEIAEKPPETIDCNIYNWCDNKVIAYKSKEGKLMKFDFCIGNPPYQQNSNGANESDTPLYHYFYEAAFSISDKVELITPARFLFNAGYTPKDWNEKMLSDTHFKILHYEPKSNKIFSNTDIKGGIAISYRNVKENYGAIGAFTPFSELNSIKNKVSSLSEHSLSEVITNRGLYRYSELAYKEQPEEMKKTADPRIAPSCFERMPLLFTDIKPNDGYEYIQIFGLLKNERCYKWFRKDYIKKVDNLYKYKVMIPKANGSGAIGEVLSTPLCGVPLCGFTETFISIGETDNKNEAEATLKYVKTKFARTMLGILKVTQNNARPTWKYVPLQDFTSSSDIDWSQSISDIDKQLYKKYNLSEEEINFIETNVKEME